MKLFLPTSILLLGISAHLVRGEEEPLFDPPPIEQAEPVAAPAAEPSGSTDTTNTAATKVSLPYTPYPAGLSWMPTPQPFRVPIPDRIYYPPHTYVKRCPYYPRGYYWGANWNRRMLGGENLLFGSRYRYNPYWTAAKASHRPKLRGLPYFAPPPGPEGQAQLLGVSAPPPRLHGHGPHLTKRPEGDKLAKSDKKPTKTSSHSPKSVVKRKANSTHAQK